VVRGQPIVFRGRAVEERGRLAVESELTMAGRTRPLTAELANADGRASPGDHTPAERLGNQAVPRADGRA
jgi:hypothetical protein